MTTANGLSLRTPLWRPVIAMLLTTVHSLMRRREADDAVRKGQRVTQGQRVGTLRVLHDGKPLGAACKPGRTVDWSAFPRRARMREPLGGDATPRRSRVLALVDRKLTWKMMAESMTATARTTSMIALILLGAYLLNYILSSLGVPQMLAKFLTGLPLADWGIMLVIIGFYLALGTFMEGMSMVITTIPLLFPVVKALGYDPIWFGVVITMLVEIAMISPPDGTVLYVLQGMRRQPGPITDVFTGVLPFLAAYTLAIILLMVFPAIALWLPGVLM